MVGDTMIRRTIVIEVNDTHKDADVIKSRTDAELVKDLSLIHI